VEVNFDKNGFFYCLKATFLIGAVFFVGRFVAAEYALFAEGPEAIGAPAYVAVEKSSAAAGPQEPEYQELAQADGIFANGEEVLAKSRELSEAGEEFIYIDLDSMKLTIYKGKEEVRIFPVMAKGRPGSFFETPSGFYEINYKETNHFSSIGKVWMPYSMHIFGNYFIHGWPYYPNGKPVEAAYSGGCIRLSKAGSKELFSFAKEGMQVLIYDKKSMEPVFAGNSYFRKVLSTKNSKPLAISADAALAADFETGQILFSKEQKAVFPIASVTKLMTALVASESFQTKVFRVDKEALETYGNSAGLVEGELFDSEELLYPLLLASSNDAAALYQEQGWNFMRSMNQKALAVGMRNTYYEDPSGLDQRNTSTPEDLFKLLQYIYNNKKPIFDILSLDKYKLISKNKKKAHVWENVNWPKEDGRFISGKSGYTDEALQTMAGVYKVKLSEGEERNIAVIVLHSLDREKDINKIIKNLEENIFYGNVLVKNPPEETESPTKIIFNEANIFEAVKPFQLGR